MTTDSTVQRLPDALRAAKTQARAEIEGLLGEVSPEQWALASERACAGIIAADAFTCAQIVGAYLALPREVDVRAVIAEALRHGKVVCLPRVVPGATPSMEMCRVRDVSKDVAPGALGVMEPAGHCAAVDARHIELLLVPGRGFGHAGDRLGRGGGFYDGYVGRTRATRMGVCLARQIVPAVPTAPHDQRVHALATEEGVRWCP